MPRTTRFFSSAMPALAIVAGIYCALASPVSAPSAEPAAPKYRISAGFTHDNLTIFFLSGDDQIKDRKIFTLDEGLVQKKVIVHETQVVNQLAIENTSDVEVFVQAGDIVKGGKQDRVIAYDMLLPAKSPKVPIASFCVEAGRWSRRGGEDARNFYRCPDNLVSNELKLAARSGKDQGVVWREVANTQGKLTMNTKAPVQATASPSSLALTLEHKKLLEAVDVYVKKLQGSLEKESNVVGYAVAINGKVNNADVYASAELFKKLWPKLIKASSVEAVAEKKDKLKFDPAKPEAVTAFMVEAAKGKKSERKLVHELKEYQCDSAKNVLFETQTKEGAIVRRSYIGK